MTVTADQYKSVIGLSDLYYALVTQDDDTDYVADTPKKLAPAVDATVTPTTNSNTQYADDAPFDTIVGEGATSLEMSITALPPETYAEITGKIFDAASGRVFDGNGVPPYVAVGFKSLKSTGKYVFVWFLKGRFQAPTEEFATKTDNPEPKNRKLTYTAIFTEHRFDVASGVKQPVKRVWGDEDVADFSGTDWFTQVQVPGVTSPSALALIGVVVSKVIDLTFNNRLKSAAGIVLVEDDGTLVPAAITLDATGKIASITPDSNLSASSDYIVTYDVTDIYGQTLTGAINFTTA